MKVRPNFAYWYLVSMFLIEIYSLNTVVGFFSLFFVDS